MSDLPKRLRIKASMIALGERIAWGSDTALMEEAADVIEALSESVENHQLHMLGMARDRDQLRALLTAQSAPAGEREACSECNGLGFGPFGGCGECCGSGRAAPAQPAAQDQVDQQEGLHVWRATSRLGYTCHFGEASAARAWAGENGTIERVDLTPVHDLQVVERQDQSEVQRLREALNWLRGAINCTAENDVDQCGAWISTKHPMIQRIDELLAARTGHGQGEVHSRERWTVLCGHWQDTTLAIHGERTGHIASGIDEDAAHAIVNAHNQGLPPIAAASTGQEVKS